MTRRGMDGSNYALMIEKLTPLLLITFSSEEKARRTIGIIVVAGMVALILKGLLIARWVRARRKRRDESARRGSSEDSND